MLPMNIDLEQLALNVNLHALQSSFLNLELHYIIARNENKFRFTDWRELPGKGEQKFFCFLQEKELFIPAGNIVLKESYVITQQPIYPLIVDCKDLIAVMNTAKSQTVAKGIRQFSDDDFGVIQNDLQKKFASVKTHMVTSPSLRHHIFVVDEIEISVAPSMVYFRMKAPFSESHYEDAAHA
jgi:hypothetical protein